MQSTGEQKGVRSRALRGWRWLWTDTENGDPVSTAIKSSAKQADSTEPQPSVFSRLAPLKVVAWLGASAGGLTILLGAIGFLALNAHDVMLGIPRSSNQEYVAVGGLFFARSIIFLVASFISAKSWIVLGLLVIAVIVLFNIPRRLCRGRSLAIVLCGIALLVAEIFGLARLVRPLQISNLLLNLSADANAAGKDVVDALLVKDSIWLSVEYGFLVLLVLAFSVTFLLLEQESQDRTALSRNRANRTRFWHVARVPAFILLLICIFLLPRAYGVLTISNDYPAVVIESKDQPASNIPGQTRLLLREDDKVFVLYDPTSQSIVTIKRDSITQHKVYAPQHIFTASGGTK